MSSKVFLFDSIHAQGVKVSHNQAVGLPSLTAFTGLAEAFAARLALALNLGARELVSRGVLVALENYQPIGHRKALKPAGVDYEKLASAWANFTLHLALDIQPMTPKASDALSGDLARQLATEILQQLPLAKGRLSKVRAPRNLALSYLEEMCGADERKRALALIPSEALVLKEEPDVMFELRNSGLPLMQGVLAATLPSWKRPQRFKAFFEGLGIEYWNLALVQDGFLRVDPVGVSKAMRETYESARLPSHVASATLTLVRLQKASHVKGQLHEQESLGGPLPYWRMHQFNENHWLCSCASEELQSIQGFRQAIAS